MTKRNFVMISCALLTCAQGLGQVNIPTIELAGNEFRLGMAKDTVVARLAEAFYLTPDGDSLIVWNKDSKGHPTDRAGMFWFKNGKLTQAQKVWKSSSEKSDADFVEALYYLVSNFSKEGRTACVIGTVEDLEPKTRWRKVVIQCGAKSISVGSFFTSGGFVTDIDESLAAP